jgi:hypothetical protein
MSEALVDGVILIEMDEEILEEFGFKQKNKRTNNDLQKKYT